MDAELLRQYLEFYQDLGIKTLYRREAVAGPAPIPIPMDLPPLAPVGQALPPANPAPSDLPPLAPTGATPLKIVEDTGRSEPHASLPLLSDALPPSRRSGAGASACQPRPDGSSPSRPNRRHAPQDRRRHRRLPPLPPIRRDRKSTR